jgi:hypothetical protein
MHIQPPPNAGTKYNLPEDVRKVANVRGEIIAWTKLDPDLESTISRYICCVSFGPFLFCPCFWPHLIIMWPCLCWAKVASENAARSQYWILTEKELRVVCLDHDTCCVAGCSKSGIKSQAIPLENITDAALDARGTGYANQCAGDVPTIYVDTASSTPGMHDAVGLGLANYEWFIQQILDHRDAVKAGGSYQGAPAAASMDRSGKSAAERIREITELRDSGVLTQAEFNKKKEEIVASI